MDTMCSLAFMQDVNWVDELRVRASYGETGNNMGVSLYAYQALYYIEKNAGSAAFMKQSLSAEDIKWETCQNIDFGIEGRLFDRLNFNVVLFDKRNKDLLFAVRLPLSALEGIYPPPCREGLGGGSCWG